MSAVAKNRQVAIAPVIDVIDEKDFKLSAGDSITEHGSFSWGFVFKWDKIPEREIKRIKYDRTANFASPTMAGGLFSIDREYFYAVGSYDDAMNVWGGENVEMSFRIWMCGGRLEIAPCR